MLIDAHNDVSLSARRVITDVRRSHDLVQFLPIEAIVASGIWTKTLGRSRQRSPKCNAKTRLGPSSTKGYKAQVSREPWSDRSPLTVSEFVSYVRASVLEFEALPIDILNTAVLSQAVFGLPALPTNVRCLV
jgi:hypothetical protein